MQYVLTGESSCETLCCGRGYSTVRKVEETKCRCQFHWCCRVTCDKCVSRTETHVCNWDAARALLISYNLCARVETRYWSVRARVQPIRSIRVWMWWRDMTSNLSFGRYTWMCKNKNSKLVVHIPHRKSVNRFFRFLKWFWSLIFWESRSESHKYSPIYLLTFVKSSNVKCTAAFKLLNCVLKLIFHLFVLWIYIIDINWLMKC